MENNHTRNTVEILDTTLRDGEQTSGMSFSAQEKLSIAQLLLRELRVDRIEVASARVSEGEFEGVRKIADWASQNNLIDRVEVLGFVDGGMSIEWLKNAGCRVLNLLTKGSYKHLTKQLNKTPEQHIADICREVEHATAERIEVNIYLEDWSNGMLNSPDYVFQLVDSLKATNIRLCSRGFVNRAFIVVLATHRLQIGASGERSHISTVKSR